MSLGNVGYSYTDVNTTCSNSCTFSITVNPIAATADAGVDQMTCVDGIVQIPGGIMPGTGTWTASIGGGTFYPSADSLAAYYTPPMGNTNPITLILTPDGQCVAPDSMVVTFGILDPLVLEMAGPSSATCGDTVIFNVLAASGFNDIASLQYAVTWDENKLMLMPPVVAPSIGGDDPLTNYIPSDQVNYAWVSYGSSGEDLISGDTLMTLTFKVIGNSWPTSLFISDLMSSPIEATNAQFCVLNVNAGVPALLTINPITVTCPGNLVVCENVNAFALSGGLPVGGAYTGTGVSGNMFNPGTAGVGTHTITYSYTNPNGCSNTCTFTITVNELPDISAANKSICSGGNPNLDVTSMVGGTFNWTANYGAVTHTSLGSGTGIAYGLAAISETLTNPTNAAINVTYTLTPVGPAPTYCLDDPIAVIVTVQPKPTFGFTAATSSGGSQSGNNSAGPSTITANFCAGDQLTLSLYSDNGSVGYMGSYTTSGNITYDGGALGAGPVLFDVFPNDAAGFFNAMYGGALGYGLSSSTSGTITQVFTPYIDINGNNAYDLGIDCLGDPITLQYNIYAIPTVTATPPSATVCNNTPVNIAFNGNYGGGATYSWSNDNPAIGLPVSGTGALNFIAVNTGMTNLVANVTVTPSANGCDGTPIVVTITVHPEPVVSLTATVAGGTPQTGSNAGGPATVNLIFCAGQSFTYTGFTSPPGVSFKEEIVAGTTNLLYNGGAIPVPRPPTSITAAGAAAFFAGTYGPYSLAPGQTYGWMDEVFTPFYDVDGDGIFDVGIDCWGDPITVHYTVYGLPTGTATPSPATICSGGTTSIALGSDIPNTTFAWVVQTVTGTVSGQAAGSGNSIAQTLSGSGTVTYRVTPTVCPGSFYDVLVTVQPPITASITLIDNLLCKGESVVFTFHESAYPLGTEFTVTADVYPNVYGQPTITFNAVTNGDDVTLVEGVDFTGTLTVTNIQATVEGLPACTATIPNITVTVNPPFTVSIVNGPTIVHAGSQLQLFGTDNIMLPVTMLSNSWGSNSPLATVDANGLVTGVTAGGPVTITYTVTDDAGCTATATRNINVLGPLTLTSLIAGNNTSMVACGAEITVSVHASNFKDISTLDYSINWDPTKFNMSAILQQLLMVVSLRFQLTVWV